MPVKELFGWNKASVIFGTKNETISIIGVNEKITYYSRGTLGRYKFFDVWREHPSDKIWVLPKCVELQEDTMYKIIYEYFMDIY